MEGAATPAASPTSQASPPAPAVAPELSPTPRPEPVLEAFPLPPGSRPHDVAPALDGGVWYTAQGSGRLGWLDPTSGEVREIALGVGSRPHGVIVGPDGAPWVTDGGLNAIVRVDPATDEVRTFPLPADRPDTNLNTATFDGDGVLWFTGQNGVYGRLDPASGAMEVFDAPRGRGPYGIATTPGGGVYYASLAGSYVGRIDIETGALEVIEPPTPAQGARRVWADSAGRIWVSEWNAGQIAVYDPENGEWREWKLPGAAPRAYGVYVDEDARGLAQRLRRERHREVRSGERTVRLVPAAEQPGQRPPAARPARRAVGRGVGGRPARGDPLLTSRYSSVATETTRGALVSGPTRLWVPEGGQAMPALERMRVLDVTTPGSCTSHRAHQRRISHTTAAAHADMTTATATNRGTRMGAAA